jgi:hypothetical protein
VTTQAGSGDNARFNTLGIMIDRLLVDEAMQANPAFARIIRRELTGVLTRFAEKSLDYKDGAQVLGIRGQFADMNRKWIKLRAALWDGQVLTGEPPDEILQDMIAHCLLTLDMWHRPAERTETDGVLCEHPNCLVNEPHFAADHARWAL